VWTNRQTHIRGWSPYSRGVSNTTVKNSEKQLNISACRAYTCLVQEFSVHPDLDNIHWVSVLFLNNSVKKRPMSTVFGAQHLRKLTTEGFKVATYFALLKVVWPKCTGEVGMFITVWCQISRGCHIPKIIFRGFWQDYFKKIETVYNVSSIIFSSIVSSQKVDEASVQNNVKCSTYCHFSETVQFKANNGWAFGKNAAQMLLRGSVCRACFAVHSLTCWINCTTNLPNRLVSCFDICTSDMICR